MIRRKKDEIHFECDGCGEDLNTFEESWDHALAYMKDEKWLAEKFAGEWQHMCPRCK